MITKTMTNEEIRKVMFDELDHYFYVINAHDYLSKFNPSKFPAKFRFSRYDKKNNWEVIMTLDIDSKEKLKKYKNNKGVNFNTTFTLKVMSLERIWYYTIRAEAFNNSPLVCCISSHLLSRMRERNPELYGDKSDEELIEITKELYIDKKYKTKNNQYLGYTKSGFILADMDSESRVNHYYTYLNKEDLSEFKKELRDNFLEDNIFGMTVLDGLLERINKVRG